MPETPSTHPDIDRAFEALAHDVMDRTAPPSAFAAIKQARRRRRTALATVVAAAVVVVAGLAVPTLADRDDSTRVAAEGQRPLPVPAEFAPAGWELLDWTDMPSFDDCLSSLNYRPVVAPVEFVASGQAWLGRGDDRLVGMFTDFGEHASSAEQAVSLAVDTADGCGSPTQVVRYTDGAVQHFVGTEDGTTTDLWVARLGNRVGFSAAIGEAAATPDQRSAMGDSVMAALQHPDTWVPAASAISQPEGQEAFGADVSRASIDEAFGGWFTDWRQARVEGGLPCAALTWVNAIGSGSLPGSEPRRGGGVTISAYDMPTVVEATAARERLLSDLVSCNSTRWSITETGPDAWLATSDAGSLWIAERGRSIGWFEARDGLNPPADVGAAVTALLTGLMEAGEQ